MSSFLILRGIEDDLNSLPLTFDDRKLKIELDTDGKVRIVNKWWSQVTFVTERLLDHFFGRFSAEVAVPPSQKLRLVECRLQELYEKLIAAESVK